MLVARRTESLHSGYRLRFNVCFDCGLVPINEILSPLCNTAESLYTKFSELFFVYVSTHIIRKDKVIEEIYFI